MKKRNLFLGAFLSISLIMAGTSVFLLKNNENKATKVEATFVEPNDVYNKIFSDDFNNVAYATGYNNVLLCFTGTANGLDSSDIYDASVLDNIFVNGAHLTNTGGLVKPWAGQNWFRVVYPTSMLNGEGTILEIKNGTVVGDSVILGFTLRLNGSDKWEFNSTTSWAGDYVFTDPVNATYSKIYNDDFNNGTHATGYNRLMIVYSGTAHGNPSAITSLFELKKYDGYVQIDGVPLSTYQGGSTQIAAWSGQPWIQFIYPEGAVSVGSILTINAGCKVGDAVLEKMTFKLNSSSKWENIKLVEDDPLVQSSDYLLFTPSDFSLTGNDTNPFYGEIGSILSDSFGCQLKITVPTGEAANMITIMSFAATNIYGSDPIYQLTLDHDNNVYLKFKGISGDHIDWSTNKVTAWSENVAHLVEFYVIHTSSTVVTYLFGLDGVLIFKTANVDVSAIDFTGHTFMFVGNSGTHKSKSDFDSCDTTTATALNRFGVNKLSASTVAFDNNADTGACLTAYAGAKAFYQNYLTNTQKVALANEGAYVNLKNRLVAWAAANGEVFNPSAKTFTAAAISVPFIVDNDKDYSYIIVIVTSVFTLSILGLFFLYRRKKHN